MVAVTRTVGRDRELQLLETLVARVLDHTGGICALTGEAGIGKSRLVGELRRRATESDVPVAIGHAELLERSRPMHVFDGVVRRLRAGEAHASGGLPQPAFAARHELQEEVIAAVERLARRPIVVVLEDLHWADEASLRTAIELARLAETGPLLLVLTSRPTDYSGVARLLDVVVRLDAGEHLELGPLSAAATQELVELVHPGLDVSELALASAGGNPYLVLELLRHGGGVAAVPSGTISQLIGLPDATIVTLRAAAVVGDRCELDVVAAVADTTSVALSDALDEAVRAQVVVVDGGSVEFRHDLVRESIYGDIGPALRTALHARAAAALLDRGASPVEVAHHVMIGGTDAAAGEVLVAAAAELITVDPHRALELVARADELSAATGPDPQRIDLRIRTLAAIGRLDEALELGRGVEALGQRSATRRTMAETLGGLAVLSNRPAAAIADVEAAIDRRRTGDVEDADAAARLYALLSLLHMSAGDIVGARAAAAQADELTSDLDDPEARCLALAVRGRLATFDHEYAQGLELARASTDVAALDPSGDAHRWLPWFLRGLTELDLDDLDGVRSSVVAGRSAARQVRAPWGDPLYSTLEAAAAFRAGSLDDAGSLAESAAELALSYGSTQALAWAHAVAALVSIELGELDAAHHQAVAATDAAAAGSMLGADYVVLVNAVLAGHDGDDDAALAELAGAWEVFEAMCVRSSQPVIAPELARRAADAGRVELAARVSAAMAAAAARADVAWLANCAERCAALTDRDPGRLRRVIDRARGGVRPLEVAAMLDDLAHLDPSTANVARDEAISIRAAHGADPAGTGGTAADLDVLTATERVIVELACEGLTNSEIADRRFVSRRTVESHLARAFRKLGVRTRAQLIVAVLNGR